MIFGYVRVSTDHQTNENQKMAIREFCGREGLQVDDWIEEKISGAKKIDKRKLGKLLEHVKEGDMIISTEISRLGRSLFMVMEILNICMEKNVKVWTIKDNYRLGDGIESKVLAFAFGLAAEIERKMISERTKQGLARVRAEGVVLGRPKGRKSSYHKLDPHKEQIQEWLDERVSKSEIGRRLKVHRNTVRKFMNEHAMPMQTPLHVMFNEQAPDGIQELLDSGKTRTKIAEEFGVAATTVERYIVDHDLKLPVSTAKKKIPSEKAVHPLDGKVEVIRKMLEGGTTQIEIAEAFGVSAGIVGYFCKINGLSKTRLGTYKLAGHEAYIFAQLMQGKTLKWLAKDLEVGAGTMQRFVKSKNIKSWMTPDKEAMKGIEISAS